MIRLTKTAGGFLAVRVPDTALTKKRLKVRVAFACISGNPFRLYEPFDFVLNQAPIQVTVAGGSIESLNENEVVAIIADDSFRLAVTGFAATRDLEVKHSRGLMRRRDVRRFNYTGRRKISRDDVRVSLHSPQLGDFFFSVALDLAGLLSDKTVPPQSPVVIEAYGGTKFERFAFGTLAAIDSAGRRKLEMFTPDERVMFRLKVVDSRGDSGMILAMADKIQPASTEPLNHSSLLHVCVRPLDGVVFKVEIDDDDFPTLVLNSCLDGACAEGI
ncbi:MAG: hypothetical protein IPK67_20570, partial [Planctomycetes bacterium]|nr:hypothetical protein [Planctomycetota bacterium]